MSTSRDHMLNAIRSGLNSSRAGLQSEAARVEHTPPPFVHPPTPDLITQFVTELTHLEGKPHRCANPETALSIINTIIIANQADSVIAWDPEYIHLPGLDEFLVTKTVTVLDDHIKTAHNRQALLQNLECAPVCISGAHYGIAESGTLLILHGPGRARIASLLAPIHIAILPATQIVRGLGEALTLLRTCHGNDIFTTTGNLTLITGPSRTADIEMTLTLGIHGPRELHVLIIE